jgi:large subunit ribosomal protein L18
MIKQVSRNLLRRIRAFRIRKKLSGTSDRPRLSVYKGTNLYVQIIDDSKGLTLASSSSIAKDLKGQKLSSNKESAKIIGADIAKKALAKGINKIVFDRSGYAYCGVIEEIAKAARENGLEF